MAKESVHPFLFQFVSGDGKAEAGLIEYQNALKSFRPGRTVLDADKARSQDSAEANNYMTVKRRHHDKYIEKMKLPTDEEAEGEERSEGEEAAGEKSTKKKTGKKGKKGKGGEDSFVPPAMAATAAAEVSAPALDAANYTFKSDFRDSSSFISAIAPNGRNGKSNAFAESTFSDVVLDMAGEDESALNRDKNRKIHHWDAKQRK